MLSAYYVNIEKNQISRKGYYMDYKKKPNIIEFMERGHYFLWKLGRKYIMDMRLYSLRVSIDFCDTSKTSPSSEGARQWFNQGQYKI